ncbi:hypothetical protein [Pseudodonghicola flavimaris]|uniref:Sulfotransferase family protein n=1 Tax=Pseudodonghicola flavimaris TaxID=3050036 RepID=A0ABT7F3D2_9RHOB|nr:hypothetical protein [Pseudodonghicola flavimaris]MDK3019095.1 hypothetical protein [Pseudodonghicola flavimaris]
MIAYDPSRPLIFIHVPKCAGTSIRPIMQSWFGAGFHSHYIAPATGQYPDPVDFATQPVGVPQLVYGHFNARIGLGIPDQYPDVRQFVTILRDPLETAVSEYFYSLQQADPIWRRRPRAIASWIRGGGLSRQGRRYRREKRNAILAFSGVEDFVLNYGSRILEHFPVKVTEQNYAEVIETRFVEIGVMENLAASMERIARALGKTGQLPDLPHVNRSGRHPDISAEVAAAFRETYALDYKVYDHVRARYEAAEPALGSGAGA